MIVDILRGIIIFLKFIFWDAPKAVLGFLFVRQNQRLKDTFERRVARKR